jgi:hypothetical protein
MRREIAVGRVDARLVPVRPQYARAQVVGHDLSWHAAEELQRAHVRPDPVGQALAPGRLGVGAVRRAEHRDEHLRRAQFAGAAVQHLHRVPGVVDEQPLASGMGLSHGRRQTAFPAAVEFAPTAVAITAGMGSSVFFPEQEQGDARSAQLMMDLRPIRLVLVPLPRLRAAQRREQQRFQARIGQRRRQRPDQPGRRNAVETQTHRAPCKADRHRDRAVGGAELILQPQDLTHSSHRHSLGRHWSPSRPDEKKTAHLPSGRATPPPQGWPTSDRNGRHQIGISGRHSLGMPGRLAPEYAMMRVAATDADRRGPGSRK